MTVVSNYALRLQTSLMDELRAVVEEEGTTLNEFINVAVAEKLSALRTSVTSRNEETAPIAPTIAILEKSGTDVAIEGDELPSSA